MDKGVRIIEVALYVENKKLLGILWCFKDIHRVDFAETICLILLTTPVPSLLDKHTMGKRKEWLLFKKSSTLTSRLSLI